MDLSNWFLFGSIITLASISPGPNVLAVVVNTLESGKRGAVFTIFGNLIALFTIALAAAAGVGALLHAVPSVFTAMKLAGGVYLAWMGVKMIKGSFNQLSPLEVNSTAGSHTTSKEFVFRAMLISYSNPKSILFLSAVFPAFLDNEKSLPLQFMVMFTTIICIVSAIHGLYAILAIRMRSGLIGTSARKMMARVSGITFFGFGLGFVYDAQR